MYILLNSAYTIFDAVAHITQAKSTNKITENAKNINVSKHMMPYEKL